MASADEYHSASKAETDYKRMTWGDRLLNMLGVLAIVGGLVVVAVLWNS